MGLLPPSPQGVHPEAGHGAHIQMVFVSRLPSGSPKIAQVGILAILDPHNFASRPSIEMRFEAKL
jgi:hypothetical protein